MKKYLVPVIIVILGFGVWLAYSFNETGKKPTVDQNSNQVLTREEQSTGNHSESSSNQIGERNFTASGSNNETQTPEGKEEISEGEIVVIQNALKDAIGKVKPSVVLIEVTKESDVTNPFEEFFNDPFFKRFFDESPLKDKEVKKSLGSGFIVGFEGKKYILTNRHVVSSSTEIRITTPQGLTFDGELIGSDSRLDVAIIKPKNSDMENLPAVKLGDSDSAEIGDLSIAIGNPLGLSHTVTWGIISAMDRDVPRPGGEGYFRSMIQTDAAINPGNSGGPLVNIRGEVVAINTAIARFSEGINFAIPINYVKQILPQLTTTGEVTRAWLGVVIQDLTPSLAQQFGVEPFSGVLVSQITKDSPAAKAGIKPGDILVTVEKEPVTNTDELQSAIMFKEVGQKVTIALIRGGEKMDVQVTLAERPPESELLSGDQQENEPQSETEENAVSKFGISVRDNSEEIADQLGLNTSQGVVISDIGHGSKADWAELQLGDVILEGNGQEISSVDDWNRIISNMDEDKAPILYIMRGNRTFYVSIE